MLFAAGRARLWRPVFLSIGSFNKDLRKILLDLPIARTPEIDYTIHRKQGQGQPDARPATAKKLEKDFCADPLTGC